MLYYIILWWLFDDLCCDSKKYPQKKKLTLRSGNEKHMKSHQAGTLISAKVHVNNLVKSDGFICINTAYNPECLSTTYQKCDLFYPFMSRLWEDELRYCCSFSDSTRVTKKKKKQKKNRKLT